MSVGFVLTIMVLTTEGKVFIVEHYFRPYGVGRQKGLSLRHVREHYEEQFNETAPSYKTILAIVEKFHRMGSVLCQRKGSTLWWSLNFPWNGISIPFTLSWSHGPRCLHMEHAERIRFPIRWPTGKCSLQQLVFISMSNNLWTMCETWGYTFWTHAVLTHLHIQSGREISAILSAVVGDGWKDQKIYIQYEV